METLSLHDNPLDVVIDVAHGPPLQFHYFHHGKLPAAGAREGAALYEYDRLVLAAAAEVNIRIVLLCAYYGQGGLVGDTSLSPAQRRFETAGLQEYQDHFETMQSHVNAGAGPSTQSVGVVAHSIRALTLPQLQGLLALADSKGAVFHMHVEEQLKEIADCKAANGGRTPSAACWTVQTRPGCKTSAT